MTKTEITPLLHLEAATPLHCIRDKLRNRETNSSKTQRLGYLACRCTVADVGELVEATPAGNEGFDSLLPTQQPEENK